MEVVESLADFWDFTDPFVDFWRGLFKLPDDMMRLSICLIVTYPAVLLHRFVMPGTKARLVFSLFVGLFWAFFCFKWEALYYVGTGLFTYLACWLLPSKHCPRIVVVVSFAVLSYGYIYERIMSRKKLINIITGIGRVSSIIIWFIISTGALL